MFWQKLSKKVLSASLAACMILPTALEASAELASLKEPEIQWIYSVESEPSEYGYVNVDYYLEDGTPYDMYADVIPEQNGLGSDAASLPSSYDMRDYGVVTSVKDQNPTGTCWAHAALSVGEISLVRQGLADTNVDLSEAHMVWFSMCTSNKDTTDPMYGDGSVSANAGTAGYDGGNNGVSRSILGSWIGAALEADYPNIVTRPVIADKNRYDSKYHLQNSYEISMSDPDVLKSYLINNGALTFSYYADDDYCQTTSKGTSYYQNVYNYANHEVTLIGWDDNYSKSNFVVTPPADGAWLCKNSWGTWWGDEGYFWISYYDTSLDSTISTYEMGAADDYSTSYRYASMHYGGGFFDDLSIRIANIYTKTDAYPLAAVSFLTNKASTPYKIEIYSGSKYGSPESGTLVHSQEGTATYYGLHTVELTKLVNIPEGTNFSVVITYKKNGTVVHCDDYSYTTGRSFYSAYDVATGTKYNWNDLGASDKPTDVYMNVLTSNAKVQNVKATAGDGQVKLTWDAVEGATKYCVALYNASTKKYTVKTDTLTTNSYTVTGLTNGTTYYFLVQCYVNGAWSKFTTADHVSATPVGTAAKPTNIKATAGDGKVTLTWDKVTGATKYCVALYNASTKKYTVKTNTLTTNSYTVTGLTNGTTYYFLVQAYANGAWSKFTTADHVSATPVGASTTKPTNIKATAGDGKVTLTWDKVTGATKYCVALYNASTKKYTVKTNTLTTNSYTVTGLTNGTTYYFLVQAYANGAWSKFTTADHVSATPVGTSTTKPTNIKAVAGDGKVTLTWNKVTGATKYCVALYNASTKKYTVKTNTLTTNSYTVTGLTNGTTYYFLVQAYANGAWSKFTTADHVSATPVGASSTKPTNIKATAGNGQVTLTWNKVTGATKYCVALYNASTKKYTVKTNTLTTNSYTVTGLTNGTTYYFLVQAYANGAWSKFTTADHVSATPVGVSTKPIVYSSIGDSQVALAWNAVSGATKYAIASYNASTGKYSVLTNTYTETCCYITGLVNNYTYRYLVQAYVNGKWSTFTTADLIVVTPKATAKPNVIATAGNGRGRLVWADVTGATKYAVSSYYPATGKYTVLDNNWTSTNCEFNSLTNGTTYTFLVQAYVNGAWSKFSTADHVTITPAASSAFINAEEAGAAAYSDEQMDDSDLVLDENNVLYQF